MIFLLCRARLALTEPLHCRAKIATAAPQRPLPRLRGRVREGEGNKIRASSPPPHPSPASGGGSRPSSWRRRRLVRAVTSVDFACSPREVGHLPPRDVERCAAPLRRAGDMTIFLACALPSHLPR